MSAHLPPECLHLIVNHLAENSELDSLAALLVVSKTVCQFTLPYKYSNPFHLFEQAFSGSIAVLKFRQLIRLLLTTYVAYGDYSDLLKAMYEIDEYSLNESTPPRPLKIKYLKYLRHFDLTQELINLASLKSDTLDTFPRLSQYVDSNELKQKLKTEQQENPYDRTMVKIQVDEDNNFIIQLKMVLHRGLS
ncbi:hypothetical protein BG006_006325 [Podila minutissima]|uniref:Uncharacterized protein n=1 Tax=Podila minutissima TaxID=64525 RepID=A0A9P5SJI0_9FUNG|nr:hypothetical protein BG006_006325 [Podila minutissima]